MIKPVFKRRPYQVAITKHIISNERCNVFATMGAGKTGATLWALNMMYQAGILDESDRVLILAPLRVASGTWPAEKRKFSFPALTVIDATGNESQRMDALASSANVICLNYDVLEWLVEFYGTSWPFTVVVADESTRLKSFRTRGGTKRSKALGRVAHKYVKRFINLTGTPAPNGLKDLWGQMWFLDKGERLGTSFKAFTDRWFTSRQVGESQYSREVTPCKGADTEIHKRCADLSVTIDAAEYFGCDKPVFIPVKITLPSKARKIYDAMEQELFAELESGEVEAANAAAKTSKCLQIAGGAVYVTGEDGEASKEWTEIHKVKLDALESIVEELNGAPLLVAYQFKHDFIRLQKRFPHGKPMRKGSKGNEDMAAWNRGEYPIMFVHPASAGHGLNLQDGGHHLAFFSDTWNLEQFLQVIERIGPVRQFQSGHPRPVYIYIIQAEGTLDELVAARRDSKNEVQDALMEYMKAKLRKTK